jgi:hypothetical protein
MAIRPKAIMRATRRPSALLVTVVTVGIAVGNARVASADSTAELIAHARQVEAEQRKALSGRNFEIASHGVFLDGKKRHELATWRKIEFGAPGSTRLTWMRGLFDGQPVDEDGLREKMGGKKKKTKTGAELLLLSVLEPLSDAEISYLGPAADGGARLYVVPHHPDKVLSVMVEIDAAGRKRSATPRLSGEEMKYVDKIDFTMRFADDGGPLEFHSFTSGHFLWWKKSLEMNGHRVP